MIRKENGEYCCECTECGMGEFGGTIEDFREFVQQWKDTGWKIRKEDDEWQHTCPDCVRAIHFEENEP